MVSQWIAQLCREFQLQEKWLVADDLRIAHQWKDQANLSGTTTVNLRPKTIRSLTLDLVKESLSREELIFAGYASTKMILFGVIDRQLKSNTLSYFEKLDPASLSEVFARSIHDLRLAKISPEANLVDHVDINEKAEDIRLVHQEYVRDLKRHGFIDYAGCLQRACDAIAESRRAVPNDLVVAMPDTLQLSRLENQLLESLSQIAICRSGHRDGIPDDGEFQSLVQSRIADRSLSVHFARGIGEVNEVRGVFERILNLTDNEGLDSVEIAHTDYRQYVPLITEQMSTWLSESSETDRLQNFESLPVTFSEGIACIYSRPGRALRAWIRWHRSNYTQSRVVQLIREGLLRRPDSDQPIGYSRLANAVRQIPIGFGRDRYLSKIADAVRHAAALQNAHENELRKDPNLEPIGHDFGQATLKVIQEMFGTLLACTPTTGEAALSILGKAKSFLATCCRAENAFDQKARSKLLSEINAMQESLQHVNDENLDVTSWLEELPVETRILSGGPMPGCVYVSAIGQSGYSGRRNLFVIGLDDDRQPRKASMDPVLLDRERKRISIDLPTSEQESSQNRHHFRDTVIRALLKPQSRLWLSYSSRDLANDRNLYPSIFMLDFYRASCQSENATVDDLVRATGAGDSFLSATDLKRVSPSDQKLYRLLSTTNVAERERQLQIEFPYLQQRQAAHAAINSPSLDAFNGYVPEAGLELDPCSATFTSSTKLETYGSCPRRFFFKYGLGTVPPDEWTVDPDQWLNPMQIGNLIHGLFEDFLRELTKQNRVPDFERDHSRLIQQLHLRLERQQQEIPVAHSDAFHRMRDRLEETCEIFLMNEESYCREYQAQPWVLEASFGLQAESNTLLDCQDPISLTFSDGGSIRIGGRIDRVDRRFVDGSERYVIWDYKTGSGFGFEKDDPFRNGRKLQPFLYMGMLRHRIAATGGNPDAVESFGYFFPSPSAEGLRIQWTRGELRGGDRVLRQINASIRNGIFLPTTDAKDCKFCDYQSVCGIPDVVADRAVDVLRHSENSCVEDWRELREISPKEGGDS